MTTPGGVLRALAAAVDTDPARWPGRDGYMPGADVDGLRDDEWLYVLPAAWRAITGSPGGDVLAVLHGRGDLAVPDANRRKSQWATKGPRWAGRPPCYKIRLSALADPAPGPPPALEIRTDRSDLGPAPGRRRDPADVDGPGAILARFWATAPEWHGAILWRDEDDTGPCPYRDCQSTDPLDAEPSRTLLYCPECDRLADYPEVRDWRRQHRKAAAAPAARQLTPAERAERDDNARRQRNRVKDDRMAMIDRALTDQRLTRGARLDLEDFYRQYRYAETDERIKELNSQLDRYQIERRSFLASQADIDRYGYDDDGPDPDKVLDGEIVSDSYGDVGQEVEPWQAPGLPDLAGILPPRALATRGHGYLWCDWCSSPGLLRVNTARPTARQLAAAGGTLPVIMCGQCWPKLQEAAGDAMWQAEDLGRYEPGRALPAALTPARYLPCPCGQSANPRKRSTTPDGRPYCTACATELTPAPQDREPNPVLALSGYETRTRRFPA